MQNCRALDSDGVTAENRYNVYRQKYDKAFKELTAENEELEKKLDSASKESVRKRLEINQKFGEFEELKRTVEALPPELLQIAKNTAEHNEQGNKIEYKWKNKEKGV